MTPLDRVEENRQVRVVDIQGGWGIRRRLGQMGIHPGDAITVVRYGAFQGPILIQVHGSQVALGRGIASRILVKEEE
jgi:ferrous iron transport protein A